MATGTQPLSDRFRTVAKPHSASILVLGSKFIAYVAPASSDDDADEILRTRTRRYPDASHHCWAFRTGRPSSLTEKSSDAGEPSGTAGRPILDALRSAQFENVMCVVTRYFGGTKLGTGGLVRAYGDAAREACSSAGTTTRTIVRLIRLAFDHDRTGIVYRALDEYGVRFMQDAYETRAHGHVEVPLSSVELLRARLHELSSTGIDWSEEELRLR